ncbi:MAG: hypothetical protein ACYDCH_14150 [Gaiellaceae bacterium]
MRRGVGALIAIAVAALLAAAPAGAAQNARYGIQDDAWLLYGPGTVAQRVATLQSLGAGIVRFTLRWDQIAPIRPADPASATDPAYRWGLYGGVLDALHARGLAAVVTLYGAPKWANGDHPANWLPTDGHLGEFATAAAREFPWVHLWTVWNEPNTRVFSVPVSPALYVTDLLNPAYAALKKASGLNQVAGGVTSPRATASGLSPRAFLIGMAAAHARLDAYAQNPYPVSPGETPFKGACTNCDVYTLAKLATIRADVTKYLGRGKALWLTEYGIQTNPPDPILGISPALQAAYIGQAALHVYEQPGVTMLIQFLLEDEPSVGGWQSGLLTAAGVKKPSYNAFTLPFAQVSRSGSSVVLWGQVRSGSGARTYVVQRKSGARWIAIGGARRTGAGGTFERTLALPRGMQLRLFAPKLRLVSPALSLS